MNCVLTLDNPVFPSFVLDLDKDCIPATFVVQSKCQLYFNLNVIYIFILHRVAFTVKM